MPKENVNGEFGGATRIEVSWAHERYVQLTTAIRRDQAATADTPEHVVYDTGAYVSLDRFHINRLIKILRRARDAAYGPDA